MMKRNFKISIAILLLMGACTSQFEELNKSKHEYTNVAPEPLFTAAVKRSIDLLADMNNQMFWTYGHQVAITSGDLPRYGSALGTLNGYWSNFYRIVYLLRAIQNEFADDPAYSNRVEIAKIWESYMYYIFATTFGGIPYSPEDRTDRTFDKETDIYTAILQTLKTASQTLDPEKDFLTQEVVFVDKDINKWIKFANSMRLKIALEVQNAIPQIAEQHIRELMQNEENLVSSNSDNIAVQWGGTNSSEYSYYFDRFVNNPSLSFSSQAFFSHLMFIYMRSYPDPRMGKYAQPPTETFSIRDTLIDEANSRRVLVTYTVPYNGSPKSTQLAGMDGNEGSDVRNNPFSGSNATQFSRVHPDFLKADGIHMIIWYSDVCFMKAEAALKGYGGQKTAEQYYYDGIDASFTQYGLTLGQSATYKDIPGVKWGTEGVGFRDFRGLVNANISNNPMSKIITQRWLAGYFHGSHDAWSYIRRTRLIDLPPHLNPGNLIVGGVSNIADLLERMHYPTDEYIYNRASYDRAVTDLGGGGDIVQTYLKIALPYNRKDWRNMPVSLNNDAYVKWYGNTISDLDNAGVNYNIIGEVD